MANAAEVTFDIEILPDEFLTHIKNQTHTRNSGLGDYWFWKKASIPSGTSELLVGNLFQSLLEGVESSQQVIDAGDLCVFLYIHALGTEDLWIVFDGTATIDTATTTHACKVQAGDSWFATVNNAPYTDVHIHADGSTTAIVSAIIKKV